MARSTNTARKTTAKKAPTKRPVAKKAAAKKTAAPVRRAKKHPTLDLRPIRTKLGRTELVNHLMEETEADKKTVRSVLEALVNTMKASVMPKGCGEFSIPGVLTITTRKVKERTRPAIKAGTLVRNPRTGEEYEHPGRKAQKVPATVKVRVRGAAKLKRAALGTE